MLGYYGQKCPYKTPNFWHVLLEPCLLKNGCWIMRNSMTLPIFCWSSLSILNPYHLWLCFTFFVKKKSFAPILFGGNQTIFSSSVIFWLIFPRKLDGKKMLLKKLQLLTYVMLPFLLVCCSSKSITNEVKEVLVFFILIYRLDSDFPIPYAWIDRTLPLPAPHGSTLLQRFISSHGKKAVIQGPNLADNKVSSYLQDIFFQVVSQIK